MEQKDSKALKYLVNISFALSEIKICKAPTGGEEYIRAEGNRCGTEGAGKTT
jgi:hypothetical protein